MANYSLLSIRYDIPSLCQAECRCDEADLIQVPESSFTIHSISPVTSTLPAETRDNWASFVVALLRYTRLPDEGGFEAIHTKYTALVTAYTSAELFRR